MIPNQKKVTFNSYNDGILHFGDYIEGYDEFGDATKKEFVSQGRLFFAFSSIREQDALKYADTGVKVTLKVRTPFFKKVTSSAVIQIHQQLFSIGYLEPSVDQRTLFLYLTELKDDLNEKIEILYLSEKTALTSPKLNHFKTVWADIKAYNYKTNVSEVADRRSFPVRKRMVIRYLSELDPKEGTNLNKYQIRYKNRDYKIIGIEDLDEQSKLLELLLEAI